MVMWNPWRGCHKCSDGCLHCYIHKGDSKRGIDTNIIVKTKDFYKPIEKYKNGNYKVKSGIVYVCFSSDFFLEDADLYRKECFEMMKERDDLTFIFLTKRIERFNECIPDDWGEGYDNVVIGCTIENQENANRKLKFFSTCAIQHKYIIAQPLLEDIDIEDYLEGIECVVVGGESDINGRVLDYDWVKHIKKQCEKHRVSFEFRQAATHFIKDHKQYYVATKDLTKIARIANLNTKG